jgi:hypothetical protein
VAQYPGSGPTSVVEFSSANILETMDTAVLDGIKQRRGDAAVQQVYDAVARSILDTLVEKYGDHWVLVPLDAGHGGDKSYWWDPGSNGTEALHTRDVVATMSRLVVQPAYRHIILKPIFNDKIPDNFGIPANLNEPVVDQSVLRLTRASMLAAEATAWNRSHPDATDQVVVHEVSVHFDSGAGGALVLYQGDVAPADLRSR